MEGKRAIYFGALIVLIVIAAIVVYKRTAGSTKAPDWVMATAVKKIDMKTLEISAEPLSDWLGKYAADKSGAFKSPKTGQYTMVDIMKCTHCGKDIPDAPIPSDIRAIADPGARMPEIMKIENDYECPYCHKKNPGDYK